MAKGACYCPTVSPDRLASAVHRSTPISRRADGKRRHSPGQTQGTGWLTGAGCFCRTCLHRCDLCAGCCAGAAFSRTPHCGRPRKRLAARSVRVVPQQHHCSLTPALWAARGPHVHMCRNLLPTLAATATTAASSLFPVPAASNFTCNVCRKLEPPEQRQQRRRQQQQQQQ